jgi:hypothetical protein
MIYVVTSKDETGSKLLIERKKHQVNIKVIQKEHMFDVQESSVSIIDLDESDLFDLIGVLNELRKRILNSKNN